MGTRPFRWFPHDGQRHAVADSLAVGDIGETLCERPVTVPHDAPSKAEWCWPTCAACDSAWRLHEGILPFPRPSMTRGHTARSSLRVVVRA
ncbi:zinc finger protein [Umezawaea tangerina]|uniref:zinc finger protein n=1 Tax=Umezawaea tangerina TaxID=84725 RepID=UPI000D04C54C|nr:zinc finger protein [Umezawaea tangerina]